MNEAGPERTELLRKIFDPETSDNDVRKALAQVISLELPPPVGHPIAHGATQGAAGYILGQESVIDATRSTVRRVLFGGPPNPVRLDVTLRADGSK